MHRQAVLIHCPQRCKQNQEEGRGEREGKLPQEMSLQCHLERSEEASQTHVVQETTGIEVDTSEVPIKDSQGLDTGSSVLEF